MKTSRLVIVGLMLAVLVTPIAWADSEPAEGDGIWGLDWIGSFVSWVSGLITEEPDPVGTRTELLSPVDTSGQELQSTPSDSDRQGSLDPAGNPFT